MEKLANTFRISDGLIQEIDQDVAALQKETSIIDVPRYLDRWLPVNYPNKGLKELVAEGRTIEIHHEALNSHDLLLDMHRSHFELESLVNHYGNTHQRDYCYIVGGHRFDQHQVVQFRGVLGANRLYKLILMLILSGCPASRLQIVDHNPDYLALARSDLSIVDRQLDLVVVGGLVVAGHKMGENYRSQHQFVGNILSGQVLTDGHSRVLLTTFPYGDLCFYATQALFEKVSGRVIFTGSAGSLDPALKVGEICVPTSVADEDVSQVDQVSNDALGGLSTDCQSAIHGNIRTPLLETESKVWQLTRWGVTSIDVEAWHFHRACKEFPHPLTQTGILLYISDVIGKGADFSKVDFSDLRVGRRRIVEIICTLCEQFHWR